jgi:dolichol kinase
MADAFNFFMVIALGTMAGTGSGLVLGSIAGKQKGKDSEPIRKNKIINSVMVITCTFLCIVILAYYSLFYFG